MTTTVMRDSASYLFLLGAVLVAAGSVWGASLPELTVDNVDQLTSDRWYMFSSRWWAAPLSAGLTLLAFWTWLMARRIRLQVVRRASGGFVLDAAATEKTLDNLYWLAGRGDHRPFAIALSVTDSGIGLWSGLLPHQTLFIPAEHVRDIRASEVTARFGRRGMRLGQRGIEFVYDTDRGDRLLSFAILGGGFTGIRSPSIQDLASTAALIRSRLVCTESS